MHLININNRDFSVRKTARILGVTIGRGLTFKIHCKGVRANCRSRLISLRSLSRPYHSNNWNIRLRIDAVIIESRLLYGLKITYLAMNNVINVLPAIFNRYIRIVTGLHPSSPADAAFVEAGLLPFRFLVIVNLSTKAAVIAETYICSYSHPTVMD